MFCLLQMTTDLGQDNDDMERKPTPPKRLQPLLWTDPVEITTKVTLGPLSKTGSKLCDLQLRRVYESQVSIKEVTEDCRLSLITPIKVSWGSRLKENLK